MNVNVDGNGVYQALVGEPEHVGIKEEEIIMKNHGIIMENHGHHNYGIF